MTRTNWSRCSRVAIVLLVVVSLAAPAAAVTVDQQDVPEEAQVGTQVTAGVTLTEPFRNPQLERWQIRGQTELTNVTWTVTFIDQTGAESSPQQFTGQTLEGPTVRANEDVSEVRVRITGTVPPVDEYTYDPPQRFLLMSLTQAQQGGASSEINSWETHHYTNDSRSARQALDAANASIQEASDAGADTSTAESSFSSAVDAYENGNFDNAENLATRAEDEATSAQQSSQTRQQLLFAGAGVVVVLLAVGGFLYWRSKQDKYDKLG